MSATSIFDKLPDEILSYIMTVMHNGFPDLDSQHRLPGVMLLLSQRFYHVALHTPYIWTTTVIGSPFDFQPLTSRLKRSGLLPLYIKIRWTEAIEEAENIDHFATLLIRESHRLAEFYLYRDLKMHLSLAATSVQTFVNTLLPPSVSFPLLNRLELYGDPHDYTSLPAPHSIPKLEYLKCRRIGSYWAAWPRGILRELHLVVCENIAPVVLLSLLAGNPCLQVLHIQDLPMEVWQGDLTEVTPISMARLEVLRLLDSTPLECNIVLAALDVPLLRTLVLEGRYGGDEGWTPLCKSFPNLKELSVLQWPMPDNHSRPFFGDLVQIGPNVTHFRFDSYYPTFAMLPSDQFPTPFPKLRHLATHMSFSDAVNSTLWDRSSPLEQLSLHVRCLGLRFMSTQHSFSLHEKFLADICRDFKVNFYGKPRGGDVYQTWELRQAGIRVHERDADAPEDGFVDFSYE